MGSVRKSVRSTSLMRGFCNSSTHPESTLGPWGASWHDGSPEQEGEKTRSLTSIVLGVDKRVQFDQQPPTLPPRSNVLRTLGSTLSQATRLIQHHAKERKYLSARAQTRWRQDGSKFVPSSACGMGDATKVSLQQQRHAHRATELKCLVVKADTQARWRHEWSKFDASWACGQGMTATP